MFIELIRKVKYSWIKGIDFLKTDYYPSNEMIGSVQSLKVRSLTVHKISYKKVGIDDIIN